MRDFRKTAVLVAALALTLFLGVQFIRLIQPAQARAVRAACAGLRPSPQNPTFGQVPDRDGRFPQALEFSAQTPSGEMVKLSDYRGKVVLVNFWASWCNVCKSEKPSLEALQERYGRDDVVVLALASDPTWEPVSEALPEGTGLSVLLDPPREDDNLGAVARAYGITAVPETFVIDRQGYLRHYFVNKRDWSSDVARTCITALLDE